MLFDKSGTVCTVECRVGGVYIVSGCFSMLLSSCADATVDFTLVEESFL